MSSAARRSGSDRDDVLSGLPLLSTSSNTPNYQGLSSTPAYSGRQQPISPPVRRRPVSSEDPAGSSSSRRILDRDGYFHQSLGHWNIQRTGGAWLFFPLYSSDPFHSLLNAPTFRIYSILFVSYLGTIYAFGAVYLAISTAGSEDGTQSCSMDISNMLEAYYFSLSTMTTIGYGVSDYYFGDCWSPLLVISLQCCVALVFDALAIGIIFQRLSRVAKRASTIIFSDRAVIRRVRGRLYFMFQVCELRKHQLIEAHVRVYCVRHERALRGSREGDGDEGGEQGRERPLDKAPLDDSDDGGLYNDGCGTPDSSTSERSSAGSSPPSPPRASPSVETVYFQSSFCRLSHPSDSLGSSLLLSFPNVVVHPIDDASPLRPNPAGWIDALGRRHDACSPQQHDLRDDDSPGFYVDPPRPFFPRDVVPATPGGGEGGPLGRAASDRVPKPPTTGRLSRTARAREQRSIEEFMSDREVELVVLVEGIDEMTSQTLQARHSYRWDDIAWHHTFAKCVGRGADRPPATSRWGGAKKQREGGCEIDVSLFHDLVPCEEDADEAAMVANVA